MIWLAVALASESLPTPFTAEQIREAFQPGLVLEFDFTEGEKKTHQVWTVKAATAEDVTIHFQTVGGDEATKTSRFEELRQHALFPAESASRSEVRCATPLGERDCWHYVVSGEPAKELWFAKDLPGPPVLMTVTAGGTEVLRMEQVKRQ